MNLLTKGYNRGALNRNRVSTVTYHRFEHGTQAIRVKTTLNQQFLRTLYFKIFVNSFLLICVCLLTLPAFIYHPGLHH